MSVHPSLKRSHTKLRSVRKRWERFKQIQEKDKHSKIVYGLPKEKIVVFKVKKKVKEKKTNLLDTILTPTSDKKVKKTSKDVGKIK